MRFLKEIVTMRGLIVPALALVLGACSLSSSEQKSATVDPKYGVTASPRVADTRKPIKKGGGHYKVGKPYKVAGKTYVPREQPGYDQVGMASWYGEAFHGRLTANGEVYDMHTFSAAHPTLPLPSYVRVTNLNNKRSIVVRVNDRGPYAHNRLIDLSKRTAQVLDFQGQGLTKVRVQYVGPAPLEGDDTEWLTQTARVEGDSNASTLMAATLPQGKSGPINADTSFGFANHVSLPKVGLGSGGSKRRGLIGLLTGYSPADRTRDSIDAAFAAFEPPASVPTLEFRNGMTDK